MDRVTRDRQQVFGTIRSIVADSLAIPAESITLESRLTDDLGADSLDFVDIVFMIEKAFSIKIRDGEMDFFARLDFSSPKTMKEGFLTREAVEALRVWLPALGRVEDPAKVTPARLFSMISIETLCILVESKGNR